MKNADCWLQVCLVFLFFKEWEKKGVRKKSARILDVHWGHYYLATDVLLIS